MTAVPTTIFDAALAWNEAGVCVLPAAPDGTKRPALPWQQYQHERPDVVDLTTWLGGTTGTYDGIGIVCGAVSGNLEMFELEGAAVAEGLHTELRELFRVAGFPELWDKLQTYVERSPAGGLHWIYRVEGAVPGNTKLARRRLDGAVQVLMETRGEGGWVVVSPSGGRTHASGKAWQTLPGSVPGDVPTLTVDEHKTLHRVAATFDQMQEVTSPPAGSTMLTTPLQPGELAPGMDYSARTDWADILIPAGWRLIIHRGDGTRLWRRPGKNVGISATTGYGDQGLDLLYVFTTSTEFESERSYSKMGAYAVLQHGGNFAAAAGELRKKGFGTPQSPQEPFNVLTLIQGEGQGVTEAVTLTQPAGDPAEDRNAQDDPPTWSPIDLREYLDGSFTPQVPELMVRTDGQKLLYSGRVHSFHGESESGKSWLALAAAAVELTAAHNVIMIDFESDAHTTVGRLLRMGVPAQAISEHFCYVRPETSPEALAREYLAWQELLNCTADLAIIDGVTEALAIFGITSKDNDEVTGWIRNTPRKLAAATGAAVVLVDHVTKDADSRGRFAIGGQAKMAALDGAAYVVEVLDPLGVGLVGRVAMRVAKDRPGGVRPHAGAWRKSDRTQEAAIVTIDSRQSDVTVVTVEKPRDEIADENGVRKPFQPTGLMEKVSRFLEGANCANSRNAIATGVVGKREFVMQAIECLIDDGYITADGPSINGGKPTLRLIHPYRESGPVPDLDPTDLVSDPASATPTRSRSNDRGTGERVSAASLPIPGNTSGTGQEQVTQLSFDEGENS